MVDVLGRPQCNRDFGEDRLLDGDGVPVRLRNLQLAPDQSPEYVPSTFFHGLAHLEVEWGAP